MFIPLIPIADVSAFLPPADAVGISVDGSLAYDRIASPIANFYDIARQEPGSFAIPADIFSNYRNYIYQIAINRPTQTILSEVGFGGPNNTRQFAVSAYDGSRTGVLPGLSNVYNNTEKVLAAFFGLNNDIYGVIPFSSTNNSSLLYDRLGNLVLTALWPGGAGYNNLTLVPPNCFVTLNGNPAVINLFTNTFYETFADFHPRDTTTAVFPLLTSLSAYNAPLDSVGPTINYNFQNWRGRLSVGAVGDNGSGSSVNCLLGLTDPSQTPDYPGFDLQIGLNLVVPTFPLAWSLKGTTYSFGTSYPTDNGVLRALTIVGDDLYAIVRYNLPTPSHLLLQGALISLNLYRTGTLNWHRSMTYGDSEAWTAQNQGQGSGFNAIGATVKRI